jgi:hypothetical protein
MRKIISPALAMLLMLFSSHTFLAGGASAQSRSGPDVIPADCDPGGDTVCEIQRAFGIGTHKMELIMLMADAARSARVCGYSMTNDYPEMLTRETGYQTDDFGGILGPEAMVYGFFLENGKPPPDPEKDAWCRDRYRLYGPASMAGFRLIK